MPSHLLAIFRLRLRFLPRCLYTCASCIDLLHQQGVRRHAFCFSGTIQISAVLLSHTTLPRIVFPRQLLAPLCLPCFCTDRSTTCTTFSQSGDNLLEVSFKRPFDLPHQDRLRDHRLGAEHASHYGSTPVQQSRATRGKKMLPRDMLNHAGLAPESPTHARNQLSLSSRFGKFHLPQACQSDTAPLPC